MSELRKMQRNQEMRAYKQWLSRWKKTKEGKMFRRPSLNEWREGVRRWAEEQKAKALEQQAQDIKNKDAAVSKEWDE